MRMHDAMAGRVEIDEEKDEKTYYKRKDRHAHTGTLP